MSKDHAHREWLLRRCCGAVAATILTLIVLVGFIVLVIYLALRPSKPSFYLQDVQLHALDLTDPAITANLQATIASRNPNDHVGIYYDRLDVYTTYREEPVTVPTSLPPIYQGHKDVSIWSPVLSGNNVPVAMFVADALRQDCAAGYVLVHVKIDGRVRWKVGSWISGNYHLFVNCPALLSAAGTGSANITGVSAPYLKFGQTTDCTVDV